MSRDCRSSFGSFRRRNFTSNSNESLDEILQSLSVDKLKELAQYVSAQIIPIDQGELQSFFAWRAKQSSINQDDTIMIETIEQILNKKESEEKEEQPCPKYEKVTQETECFEDDEQEYIIDDDFLKELEHQKQMHLSKCLPENTSQINMVTGNNYVQAPDSSLNGPSINSTLRPSTNLCIPYINMDLYVVAAIIQQGIDNLAYLPVPQGYILHNMSLSPVLTVSPVSTSTTTNNVTSVQQSNLHMTQISTSNMITTNQYNHDTFSSVQTQQILKNENDNPFDPTTETKQEENEFPINSSPLKPTASMSSPSSFKAKFNNHAKGNFFISKQLISRMVFESYEQFITNTDQQDEKLAFGYYKESVAMQINDQQIHIIKTQQGQVIIINIDIHFKSNGEPMYLIAMENDQQFRDRVRWCIVDFMSAQQIKSTYGLDEYKLPQSSRNMSWYREGIKKAPINLSENEIKRIVQYTRFKKLPSKTSKRRTGNDTINNKSRIDENDLRYYVEQSLKYDKNSPIHPVVVIKGKNQWIEWKRYIEIYDDNNYKQYVCISMRYYDSNKEWKIECMDYDAGRVFYQHRLASLSKDDQFNFSYNKLSRYITTTLEIYRRDGWY